jgi:hypothetical protein
MEYDFGDLDSDADELNTAFNAAERVWNTQAGVNSPSPSPSPALPSLSQQGNYPHHVNPATHHARGINVQQNSFQQPRGLSTMGPPRQTHRTRTNMLKLNDIFAQILEELKKGSLERQQIARDLQTVRDDMQHLKAVHSGSTPTVPPPAAYIPVSKRGKDEISRLSVLAAPVYSVVKGFMETLSVDDILARMPAEAQFWVLNQPIVAQKLAELSARTLPEVATYAELREVTEILTNGKWNTERKKDRLELRNERFKARENGRPITPIPKRRRVVSIGDTASTSVPAYNALASNSSSIAPDSNANDASSSSLIVPQCVTTRSPPSASTTTRSPPSASTTTRSPPSASTTTRSPPPASTNLPTTNDVQTLASTAAEMCTNVADSLFSDETPLLTGQPLMSQPMPDASTRTDGNEVHAGPAITSNPLTPDLMHVTTTSVNTTSVNENDIAEMPTIDLPPKEDVATSQAICEPLVVQVLRPSVMVPPSQRPLNDLPHVEKEGRKTIQRRRNIKAAILQNNTQEVAPKKERTRSTQWLATLISGQELDSYEKDADILLMHDMQSLMTIANQPINTTKFHEVIFNRSRFTWLGEKQTDIRKSYQFLPPHVQLLVCTVWSCYEASCIK